MATKKLTDEQARVLAQLYKDSEKSRDKLPYSAEFEKLHAEFVATTGLAITRHELWRLLINEGKNRRLIRKER